MINLAGARPDLVDEIIGHELRNAGIPIIELTKPSISEVRYSLIGQLTTDTRSVFTFTRLWYYWAATGPVPLPLAEELYRRDTERAVRAGGDCTAPHPSTQVTRRAPDGRVVLTAKGWNQTQALQPDVASVISEADPAAQPISESVECYHIDSAAGLKLFADLVQYSPLRKGTL